MYVHQCLMKKEDSIILKSVGENYNSQNLMIVQISIQPSVIAYRLYKKIESIETCPCKQTYITMIGIKHKCIDLPYLIFKRMYFTMHGQFCYSYPLHLKSTNICLQNIYSTLYTQRQDYIYIYMFESSSRNLSFALSSMVAEVTTWHRILTYGRGDN